MIRPDDHGTGLHLSHCHPLFGQVCTAGRRPQVLGLLPTTTTTSPGWPPDPRGADSAPVSRERLVPSGMQGALGNSAGAPRCRAARLQPESNSAPRAPIRGARPPASPPASPPSSQPHLCAPPRSPLRSRRDLPCPPWQLGPRPWPGRLVPPLRPEPTEHDSVVKARTKARLASVT